MFVLNMHHMISIV